jgi:dethiobiotin synthetase
VNFFLTGTDTGVGKTFLAVQLLRLLRATGIPAVAMKPICCGDRDDARLLLAASEEGISLDQLNPVWLRSPVAPAVAAEIERVQIDIEKIVASYRELQARFQCVVVEGVGGWLVPISENFFVSDLAARLELPVVIVTQNRLGCLNHVLLTAESVERRGLTCAGVVLNRIVSPEDLAQKTNEGQLRRILHAPLLPPLTAETEQLPPEWEQLAWNKQ